MKRINFFYNSHSVTIIERTYTNGKRFDYFVHSEKLHFKYSGTKKTAAAARAGQ